MKENAVTVCTHMQYNKPFDRYSAYVGRERGPHLLTANLLKPLLMAKPEVILDEGQVLLSHFPRPRIIPVSNLQATIISHLLKFKYIYMQD